MEKIVYIAELDQDIDDIIAAEYLHRMDVLKCIVLDPVPKAKEGIQRRKVLEGMGIEVRTKMPPVAKYVFVGGALTLLSTYITMHKVDYLIMNGGFVGCNIVKNPLEKFKGKEVCRTFNFNCDVLAADKVLKSRNIEKIMLIGKNVCHDKRNTKLGIWKNEDDLFEKYDVKDTKLQHDLLACREGLVELGIIKEESFLKFEYLCPFNTGLDGNQTKWGSKYPNEKTEYRVIKTATGWV